MYEPRYKLNKKDAARWHELLTRHCLECPPLPGAKDHRSKKFPPLTPDENVEFEKLCRKRSRKIAAIPAVRESIRRTRLLSRRTEHLFKKLERLLNIKVD